MAGRNNGDVNRNFGQTLWKRTVQLRAYDAHAKDSCIPAGGPLDDAESDTPKPGVEAEADHAAADLAYIASLRSARSAAAMHR